MTFKRGIPDCSDRVRCDLKDLPLSGQQAVACSNCKERGLKCVYVACCGRISVWRSRTDSDEFAEVKAVKLLRRGRRLQQAEYASRSRRLAISTDSIIRCRAVYGKAPLELDALRSATPPPSVIPRLAPEFFDSAFFARFQVQRESFPGQLTSARSNATLQDLYLSLLNIARGICNSSKATLRSCQFPDNLLR